MNNGMTGKARERKKQIAAIFGTPKGSAKRIRGSLSRSEWSYRGVVLVGLKLGGWGASWQWHAMVGDTPVGGPTRAAVMARVDAKLDAPAPGQAMKVASAIYVADRAATTAALKNI